MRTNKLILLTALAGVMILGWQPAANARIKLATLPARERVEIQLDNGRYTLVEEERLIPLVASTGQTGNNMIDFSWSNTQIDKNSIQLRPLAIRENGKFRPIRMLKQPNNVEAGPEISVINVAYPPGENALVWEVYANKACAVKTRVSYLIANLTRTFSYRALANKDETQLMLRNYLQVRNYSGEDFGTASVWAGFGEKFTKQVGQQEDIKMLLHRFATVPVEKTFTFDWYANGKLNADKPFASKILMHYKLTNDTAHGMGLFPLQPGKVRIFIKDGHGGEAFLGEDLAKLTPLDEEMKLYLGESRDIICTRTIKANERRQIQHNLHDQEIVIQYELENFKTTPCTLRITEQLNRVGQEYFGNTHGNVEWALGPQTSKTVEIATEKEGTSPVLVVKLAAGPKADEAPKKETIVFHFILKNLWN